MKKLILVFLGIITFSMLNAQDNKLKGDRNIIEFEIIADEGSQKFNEDQLKEAGGIMDLFFMKDGAFKQTSNIGGTETPETYEGQWKTSDNNLTLSLQIDESNIDVNYTYDLQENALVLTFTDPEGTMKTIYKFKKKY